LLALALALAPKFMSISGPSGTSAVADSTAGEAALRGTLSLEAVSTVPEQPLD
jgi:hypothetical protein